MHERYGNENVVSTAFITKLDSCSKINAKDPNSLRMFSDFLLKVVAAKKRLQSLDVLDFAKGNVKLLEKLPYSLQSKLRDQIYSGNLRRDQISILKSSQFTIFVKEATDSACIPELKSIYIKHETGSAKSTKKLSVDTLTTTIAGKSDSKVNAIDEKVKGSKGDCERKENC